MSIVLADDWKAWDDYVDAHPGGTSFHRCRWLFAVRDVLLKPVYMLASIREPGGIDGVLPLLLCRTLRDRALVSVPFRDQGGPLADDRATAAELVRAAKRLAKQVGASRVTFQRPEAVHEDWLAEEGFHPQLRGIDTWVDLSNPEAVYWSGLGRKVRQDVNRARRFGVTVRCGSDYLAEFYDVYLETRRRIGVAGYPFAFLRALLGSGCEFKLLAARLADGTPAGGLAVAIHGSGAYAVFLGHRFEARAARVVDLLFHEAISLARREGARWFLFGTDSPLQTSLLAYKEKWRGVRENVHAWSWSAHGEPLSPHDTNAPSFRWVRGILRAMPSPLFRFASRLTLHFWE